VTRHDRYLTLSIALLLALATAGPVAAQEEEAGEPDVISVWRDTLQFGIDSEIAGVLEQIAIAGEDSLDEMIVQRFARSRSTELRVDIVEHFQQRESEALTQEAERLLLAEELLPDGLVRVLVRYLSEIGPDPSEDLVQRYAELARDSARSGGALAANSAIEALGGAGTEQSVGLLLELLDETDGELQGSVIRALGRAGAQEAVPRLTSIVRDEFADASHRQYAAESLGRIGAAESIVTLTDALGDPDSLLRAYATYGLGFYPAEDTAAVLEEALLDSFWRVRVAALQALEEQEYADALPAIEYKARRDPERPVREAALRTLGAIGNDESRSVLADVARNERASATERVIAIEELRSQGAGESVAVFAEIMQSEWDEERSTVLDAIARTISSDADAAYEPLYERLLTHRNFVMQIYGVRGIGNAGLASYEDRLQGYAALEQPIALARAAELALRRMGIEVREPEPEAPDSDADESGPEDAVF
jgi:HEAT repeat protein